MVGDTPAALAEKKRIEAEVDARMAFIRDLHRGCFNLPESARDRRTPFSGVKTRFIYTKAAHFLALREMLPPGPIRLVTEMESTLPRLLPHIFADLVRTDDFTWLAMSFDKEVTVPVAEAKVAVFETDFDRFTWEVVDRDPAAETWTNSQFLRAYIAEKMTTRTRLVDDGRRLPFQNDNYRQGHQLQLWVQSPMQTSGEIDRVVGFPLVRKTLRHALKHVPWDADVQTGTALMCPASARNHPPRGRVRGYRSAAFPGPARSSKSRRSAARCRCAGRLRCVWAFTS